MVKDSGKSVLSGLATLALALFICALASNPARALVATYQWVPDLPPGGTGTMVIDHVGITDPADFGWPGTFIPTSALTSFNFTFESLNSYDETDLTFVAAAGFIAVNGVLTGPFQGALVPPSATEQVQITQGSAQRIPTFMGTTEDHAGEWRLVTTVPIPGALLLFGTGLLGLIPFAYRRKSA